jgi:hypothetical protein
MSMQTFASALCLIAMPGRNEAPMAQSGRSVTIAVAPEIVEPGIVRALRFGRRWPMACTLPGSVSVAASRRINGAETLLLECLVF